MLCALIMAGGKGTRFWPLSTEENPKQFLNLIGDKTMIQMTVDRIKPLIPIDRIFISIGIDYLELVKMQLPEIPIENIIIEPVGRNTAPCIALAALHITRVLENPTMVVLPSDHLISDENKFREVILLGDEFLNINSNAIVSIGITPTRAEVGYGYIKYKQCIELKSDKKILPVDCFVEKPSKEKAMKYLESGKYLWNGGMYIWKVKTYLELMKIYLEPSYNILQQIVSGKKSLYEERLNQNYPLVENISVDYGIMEKADNRFVIQGNFGWDDVGSWFAVERYREKDENNNTLVGKVKNLGGKSNIIYGSTKPIVIAGLEDVIFVEGKDIIFLGKKEIINNISEIRERYIS